MIDDLLDARDDLERVLDGALPALDARPSAEGAEVLAVLLVAPGRRGGPDVRLRRVVVRRLEARASPAAAAVLAAVAALADEDVARRAAAALERLAAAGVVPAIAGIGEAAFVEGWRVEAPRGAGTAVRMRRPGEPGDRLLKLWLEEGGDGGGGLLAGGWTEPLGLPRLEKDRDRFARSAGVREVTPLDAAAAAAAVEALVRRADAAHAPLSEGVALVLPAVRRAAGSPAWPDFHVVTLPGEGQGRRR